jgi:hypothetical protein
MGRISSAINDPLFERTLMIEDAAISVSMGVGCEASFRYHGFKRGTLCKQRANRTPNFIPRYLLDDAESNNFAHMIVSWESDGRSKDRTSLSKISRPFSTLLAETVWILSSSIERSFFFSSHKRKQQRKLFQLPTLLTLLASDGRP